MLQIERPEYKLYAITMRKVKSPKTVNHETYVNQIARLEQSIDCKFEMPVTFEYESGMHVHGFIKIAQDVNLIRFRIRGWSIKLVEVFDEPGWYRYIHKNNGDDVDTPIDCDDTFVMPKKKLFPKPNI